MAVYFIFERGVDLDACHRIEMVSTGWDGMGWCGKDSLPRKVQSVYVGRLNGSYSNEYHQAL